MRSRPPGVAIDIDVAVPMPDGVTLAADVYRPADAGRYPVVIVRTPYDKSSLALGFDALRAARAGWAVVVQDVRGTSASDGSFLPFHHETEDGAATISWAAVQPWSNGAIAMAGGSYMGAAQLHAATARPRALRVLAPTFAPSAVHQGWAYQGGALQLGFALHWAVERALANGQRRNAASTGPRNRAALEALAVDPWRAYLHLPLTDHPRQLMELASYGEWLAHPDLDEYWSSIAIDENYETIDVPALHIAGWHDVFLQGTLENYTSLRDRAASDHARANQRLIITPWGHVAPGENVGDLWFGPEAGAALSGKLATSTHEFLAAFLESDDPHRVVLASPPVRIFVMGTNHWRDEDAWPLARAVDTRLHLRRDQALSWAAPEGDEEPDRYAYNPADPVPTTGGNTLLPGGGRFMGPRDRTHLRRRDDVLPYTSAPLPDDLEVTGPLKAVLHVSTSAPDTDFTVALLDIYPDGRAIGLADGILRLRYRESFSSPRLARSGVVYSIEVDLVATSYVFAAGHRIGVDVSSSNFPRFDRNPNHGGVVAEATASDFVVAHQQVFHDAERPSFLILPIIK